MDGWLKALIATACIVVIAVGGWYALNEYRDHATEEAAEKEATMRSGCRQSLLPENTGYAMLRDTCLKRGYITQAEHDSAR